MKDNLFYKFAKPIIKFLSFLVFHPKYEGKENLPDKGGYVLAGTHTNNLDCFVLIAACKRQVHFLAKSSLFKGFTKPFMNMMGVIPVDRSRKNPEVMDLSREALKTGNIIGIFPEGTINKTEDPIMPFKYGAVKMAHDTKVPIIPFAITGKYKVFGGKLKIKFGKPYYTKDDIEKSNNELMKKVVSLMEVK